MRSWILAIAFVTILTLPFVSRHLQLVSEKRLRGVESVAPLPQFTFDSLVDGSYLRGMERAFTTALAFRPTLIRFDNQIRFSLFQEFSPSTEDKVVLGKDGWLFGEEYLVGSTRGIEANRAHQFADDLRQVEDAIVKHGGRFAVVFSPSKAAIYPEQRPKEFAAFPVHSQAYLTVRNALVARDITVIDAPALFEKEKQSGTKNLFAPTGTHWTLYGACLTLVELFKATELPNNLECKLGQPVRQPQGSDGDLVALTNLLFPQTLYRELYESKVSEPRNPELRKKRMTIIGSSFSWNLQKVLNQAKNLSAAELLFYFRKKIDRHTRKWVRIDPYTLDWQQLLQSDLIVLEMNEAAIDGKGYEFPAAMKEFLTRNSKGNAEPPSPSTAMSFHEVQGK